MIREEEDMMKNLRNLMVILLVTSAGCAQTVQIQGIERGDSIPKTTYTAYFYAYGEADLFRAALLKLPESDAEIVPYSVQIYQATSTFEDAMAFMQKGRGYKNVDVREVTYRGKAIGYLLTYRAYTGLFSRGSVEAQVYERGGKIYFGVLESFPGD